MLIFQFSSKQLNRQVNVPDFRGVRLVCTKMEEKSILNFGDYGGDTSFFSLPSSFHSCLLFCLSCHPSSLGILKRKFTCTEYNRERHIASPSVSSVVTLQCLSGQHSSFRTVIEWALFALMSSEASTLNSLHT